MTAHILPCVLEAELLTMLAYAVAHARDLVGALQAALGGRLS